MKKFAFNSTILPLMLPQLIDLIAVLAASFFASILMLSPDLQGIYLSHLPLGILCYFFAAYVGRLYGSWRGVHKAKLALQLGMSWLLASVVFIYIVTMLKTLPDLSRGWMLLWVLGGFFVSVSARLVLYSFARWFRQRGLDQKRVLLIGSVESCQRVRAKLANQSNLGFVFVDDYIVRSSDSPDGLVVMDEGEGAPDLDQLVVDGEYDEAWIALPVSQGHIVRSLHERMNRLTINIRYLPDLSDFRLFNHRVTEIGPLFALDLSKTPFEGGARLVKAIEDYILGFILFMISAPVMFVIAGLIKLTSPGPVLFKQYRQGLDGKLFKIYKFRTMHFGAEKQFAQAQHGDPRVTRLGQFLRRTSLDELPQFFNVLQGRMSIVGPRPHVPEQNSYYSTVIDDYMQRHRVKPGITGWAQVNGLRGLTDTDDAMRKRVEYDFYYINNWSFLLDIRIVIMTVFNGFLNAQP